MFIAPSATTLATRRLVSDERLLHVVARWFGNGKPQPGALT